jgi:hypothetical protein
MAHIPSIPISDRTLRNQPETVSFGPTKSNLGDEITRMAGVAGHAVDRSFRAATRATIHLQRDAERQAKENEEMAERAKIAHERQVGREAAAAHAEWAIKMRRGINGYSYVDQDGKEQRQQGIKDKTWESYEGTDGSIYHDLSKLEEAWQDSDTYKNLTPEVRAEFERQSMQDRQLFAEGVDRIHTRNFQAHQVVLKERADINDLDRIKTAADADDATFASVSSDACARITAREMAPVIENIDVLNEPGFTADKLKFKSDREREAYNQVVRERLFGEKGAVYQRITYLTQAGAHGKTTEGGLKPSQALDAADNFIKFLEADGQANENDPNRPHIRETESKKLRAVVRDARQKYGDLMDTAARKWALDVEADGLSRIQLPVEGDDRDQARYHAQRAQVYQGILSSDQGKGLKEHAPSKYRAFQNMAVSEANAAVSGRRKANGSKFLTMIEDGWIGDHEITPSEIQATATDLMARKEITQEAYDQAMRSKAKKMTPQARALHELIFAAKGAKFPEMCRWQENMGRFAIPESKAGMKAAGAPLSLVKEEHWYSDDKETRLFKEYVQAANYAIKYMETKNCSVDQAYAEFRALTLGTEKELAALAYDQRLQRKQDMLDALKRRSSASSLSFAKEVMK